MPIFSSVAPKLSWRNRILGTLAVLVIAFVGMFIYGKIDRSTNYVRVPAQVIAVGEVCRLERSGKRTRRTGWMNCGRAAALQEEPAYREYVLKRAQGFEYRYRSPADGRSHDGAFDLPQYQDRTVAAGQTIEILAHKSRPELSQSL